MVDHSIEPMSTKDICNEYVSKVKTYARFAKECESLVAHWIQTKGIRVHSVTSREKDSVKLEAKLTRPGKQYARLEDITDLAGVRVITYLEDDCDEIASMIEAEFEILPEHSVDKASTWDPDRFGYVSIHYVVKLPGHRVSLTENAQYKDLLCEIQIRSILQHAWAEIEHDLGYKTAAAVPRHIRRRFSRLAALLETADEEFLRIRDELSAYTLSVAQEIAAKSSEVLLDKISLRAFMTQDDTIAELDRSLAGISRSWVGPPEDYFVEGCLAVFQSLGLSTIDDIRKALAARVSSIVEDWKGAGEQESIFQGLCLFRLWRIMAKEVSNDRLAEMMSLYSHSVEMVSQRDDPPEQSDDR